MRPRALGGVMPVRFLRRPPEIHLFVIWSEARSLEDRILADLARHFEVLEEIEVCWTQGSTFASSLSRMYGDALPPGSDKEQHCGIGPFLAVVVADHRPRHRLRRTNRGLVLLNSAVFDARVRYRSWTGGGYRVHASDSVAEASRNLALLFGRRLTDWTPGSRVPGRQRAFDPVGTGGWSSRAELELALQAHGGRAVPGPGGPPRFEVPDLWWAERIVGGDEVRQGVREVVVAREPSQVELVERVPRRPVSVVALAQVERLRKAVRRRLG